MTEKNNYFEINVASLQSGFHNWPHSPNYKTFTLIKPNTKVLDVGCASGYMAKELAKKNCDVIGIEEDPVAVQAARDYCKRVIEADLEKINELPYNDGYFDYIICLDVLEHLIRPDLLLLKLKRYLNTNGSLIVSLPNIARIEHRFNLLFGNFNYSNYGALSKGHLRFFTRKTALELLISSGYKVIKIEPTGLGSIVKIFMPLLSFQFIFICQQDNKLQ